MKLVARRKAAAVPANSSAMIGGVPVPGVCRHCLGEAGAQLRPEVSASLPPTRTHNHSKAMSVVMMEQDNLILMWSLRNAYGLCHVSSGARDPHTAPLRNYLATTATYQAYIGRQCITVMIV